MSFHYPHTAIPPKEVTAHGSEGVSIQVLIPPEKAPNFIMRRFTIEPKGHIGIHSHPWEHEMFVLSGSMYVIDSKGRKELLPKDEFVFMPGHEEHGYVNEGDEPCTFICMVPK